MSKFIDDIALTESEEESSDSLLDFICSDEEIEYERKKAAAPPKPKKRKRLTKARKKELDKVRKKLFADQEADNEEKVDINAKNFFLTFPHVEAGVTAGVVGKRLLDHQGPTFVVKRAIAGLEKHEDGSPHIHMFVELEKRIRIRSCRYWDFLAGKHGNYKVTRSPAMSIRYCAKEDPEPWLYHIGVDELQDGKRSETDIVAQRLLEGARVDEIMQEHPGIYLRSRTNIHAMHGDVADRIQAADEVFDGKFSFPGDAQDGKKLVSWLTENLRKGHELPRRTKQLFIFGDSGIGKTELIYRLIDVLRVRVYWVGYDTSWCDHYADNLYDLIVFDEFLGQWPVHRINQWLGGQVVKVPCRGGDKFKRKNLPIIMISNKSAYDLYEKVEQPVRQAFLSRLEIVQVSHVSDVVIERK